MSTAVWPPIPEDERKKREDESLVRNILSSNLRMLYLLVLLVTVNCAGKRAVVASRFPTRNSRISQVGSG